MQAPTPANLTVRIDALTAIDYHCDGCRGRRPCCCSVYEIELTEAERERSEGMLPLAAAYRPELCDGEHCDPVADESDDGHFVLEKDDAGDCLLAYETDGMTRCALHSAALTHNIPPAQAKPLACSLWPLALTEPPHATLSVQEDAVEFPCVTWHGPRRTLCNDVADIVSALFGAQALQQIKTAAARGHKTLQLPFSLCI